MEKRHTIFKIVPPICDHGNWRLIFWKAVYWLSILYCHPLGPRNFLSKRVCSVSLSVWPDADKNLERGQGPIHWGEYLNKYRWPHNCLDCWKKWIFYSWIKKPIKEIPTPRGRSKRSIWVTQGAFQLLLKKIWWCLHKEHKVGGAEVLFTFTKYVAYDADVIVQGKAS